MDVTHVESRRKKILDFIIQTYVETAAPVGSEEVCRRFHLRVSPATVRHVMGELEDEALLSHPHTSAGRVPTDHGYRYYIDLLMTPHALVESEQQAIEALAQEGMDDPLDLLQAAAHLVAELTGEASAVLAPHAPASTLRRIDLIPVDSRRVLGVLMTDDGFLRHAFLELAQMMDAEEMGRVSRFFNEELGGQSLMTVHERLQQTFRDSDNAFNYLYKRAQELWELGGFMETEATLVVEGVSRLLAQPEFRDVRRSHRVVEAVERRRPVASVFLETMAQGRRRVVIGAEHTDAGLGDCGVVSAPYRAGARVAGALGVIGPTRMEYPRVVAIVDRAAQAISRAMDRFMA